jgi:hypothetical protein
MNNTINTAVDPFDFGNDFFNDFNNDFEDDEDYDFDRPW